MDDLKWLLNQGAEIHCRHWHIAAEPDEPGYTVFDDLKWGGHWFTTADKALEFMKSKIEEENKK